MNDNDDLFTPPPRRKVRFSRCDWCGTIDCGSETHGNWFYFFLTIFSIFLLVSFLYESWAVFWLEYVVLLGLLWFRVDAVREKHSRDLRLEFKRRNKK